MTTKEEQLFNNEALIKIMQECIDPWSQVIYDKWIDFLNNENNKDIRLFFDIFLGRLFLQAVTKRMLDHAETIDKINLEFQEVLRQKTITQIETNEEEV